MPDCCVCYTSDQRLLLPTFLSALQARSHVSRDAADVVIFAIDVDRGACADFARACASEGIGFRLISREIIEGTSGMYSRLFLDRFVPEQYAQLLYVDGDVQVLRSIEPLVKAAVPEQGFLAVRDPMTFMVDAPTQRAAALRAYLSGLGLSPDKFGTYFNSGMLRMSRVAWRDIGPEAYRFLRNHPERCAFHDQSALNAVSAGRHRLVSMKWNFPIFLRNCGLDNEIGPAILHFMSQPKPWDGDFPPWGTRSFRPYLDLIRTYPYLRPYYPPFPPARRAKYLLQQRLKSGLERLAWGLTSRRARILEYEALAYAG